MGMHALIVACASHAFAFIRLLLSHVIIAAFPYIPHLVSLIFDTVIPTFLKILTKMFLLLCYNGQQVIS